MLIKKAKEVQEERKGIMLAPEPKSVRFLDKLDILINYILALDEADAE